MREIVLGTAGHVDHGKTSLVRALTGIETDRLKEEKQRGITIELGFAHLDLPCGHRLGIVDVPGHEKFVKNMVAGVSGLDLIAFVVAADEGIMPQTREHFDICRLLSVPKGLVVITKKDMVDPDWLEMVIEEVGEFCKGSFLESASIIAVSSVTGEGIDQVKEELDMLVRQHVFQEAFGPFRLPIDRVFSMKGFGAVVTGTSLSGRTEIGEDLQIYPGRQAAKIRGIQVHSQAVDVVEAGHRTAINLQGVDLQSLARGMVAASPGSLQPSYIFDCQLIYLSSNSKPLKHRTRVRIHIGTAEIFGRVSLLELDELPPGQETGIQLLLEEPLAVWPDDHFVLRNYSPVFTIGGGRILANLSLKKRKRLSDTDKTKNSQILRVLRDGSDEDKLIFYLQESGIKGLTFDEIAVRCGIFGKNLKKLLSIPVSTRKIAVVDSANQRFMDGETAESIKERIKAKLKEYHQKNPLQEGILKEELRSASIQNLDQKVFQFCLNELIKQGELVQDDSTIRAADHSISLKADEKDLQQSILDYYNKEGLFAPTHKEVYERFSNCPEKMVKQVLDLLLREGKLVKISETLMYPPAVTERLMADVVEYIQKNGEIDAPAFKQLSSLTRKYSIPFLEYLDRIKVTIRVDDKRILRKKTV